MTSPTDRIAELTAENARLAATESELRALIAASNDVVLVFDADGIYRKVFETRTRSLISPPAELVGRSIDEMLPPAARDCTRAKIAEALATQRPVPVEYELPLGGRTAWLRGIVTPL